MFGQKREKMAMTAETEERASQQPRRRPPSALLSFSPPRSASLLSFIPLLASPSLSACQLALNQEQSDDDPQ